MPSGIYSKTNAGAWLSNQNNDAKKAPAELAGAFSCLQRLLVVDGQLGGG